MSASEIEHAERKSRARAVCMALLAAVTVFTATFGLQDPVNDAATFRGASWLVTVALGMLILSTGGGLNLNARLRAIMDDELSRQNRARALIAGFLGAMATAVVLYVVSWSTPIETRAALRLVTGWGMAVGLARYALLEWF